MLVIAIDKKAREKKTSHSTHYGYSKLVVKTDTSSPATSATGEQQGAAQRLEGPAKGATTKRPNAFHTAPAATSTQHAIIVDTVEASLKN